MALNVCKASASSPVSLRTRDYETNQRRKEDSVMDLSDYLEIDMPYRTAKKIRKIRYLPKKDRVRVYYKDGTVKLYQHLMTYEPGEDNE